jgi:hypothetical protein
MIITDNSIIEQILNICRLVAFLLLVFNLWFRELLYGAKALTDENSRRHVKSFTAVDCLQFFLNY